MSKDSEVRIEIGSADDLRNLAILDGYCRVNHTNRTEVFRGWLREFAENKLHEATVICRAAGVNPAAPESHRS